MIDALGLKPLVFALGFKPLVSLISRFISHDSKICNVIYITYH
jgi:hypothetical protein